jgi:Asp-tRNA(Asn)/Glu-tRNA(Gln) amidotransferase A subunit family amidase
MVYTPWLGDACSLVDAFRAGERNPVEELDATLAAIDASNLNAFSFLDPERARAAAQTADVTKPFGGVPLGVKEMTSVEGWPATKASVVFRDRVATQSATMVSRLEAAGAVPFGLTTSSEFGSINLTFTKLNGPTRNPWDTERTPGGSSGGSAAAVAGGLCTLATGGDGGGSIRIPAAFSGLPGLKNTYGRIPKGPDTVIGSLTAVSGCLSRSVRDIARYLDVCNGFNNHDPYSLPRVDNWERDLGTYLADLRGKKVVISPTLGVAVVHPDVEAAVREHGLRLVKELGLTVVDVPVRATELSLEWALAGLAEIVNDLGDRYPDCEDDLTPQVAFGVKMAYKLYDIKIRARIEAQRTKINEIMATLFDEVDFVFTATNPDIAFGHKGPMPTSVDGVDAPLGNNGALTIPANIYGNPGISIPIGTSRELPVGMQVLAPHHREAWLLDLALHAERERPWPLVAPGV